MAAVVNVPLYTVEILRLAASLPEPEALERVDGVSEVRSHTCGSIVRTQVSLGANGKIEDISQRVQACAFGQASAFLVGSHAVGRSAEDVQGAMAALSAWLNGVGELPEWPGVAALAPARSRTARHAAILLPFRALLSAIEERK